MINKKPRRARVCAICQENKVGTKEVPYYICNTCRETWKDELDSEWVKFCIEESIRLDSLLRRKYAHEDQHALEDAVDQQTAKNFLEDQQDVL